MQQKHCGRGLKEGLHIWKYARTARLQTNQLWFVQKKLGDNGPIDERATVVEFSLTNFNVRLDISSLNYPDIHVHVASNSNLGGLLGHDGLQMTSEVTSDLKIELSDLDYLCFHASLAC